MAEAATSLSREFGLSRRQAYRYLGEAQAIGHAVSVSEPAVPITLKMPRNVVRDLAGLFGRQRADDRRDRRASDHRLSGGTVAGMAERPARRSRHQVRLDYSFDRLLATKLQQVYELLVPDRVRMAGGRHGLDGGRRW